MKPAPGRIVHYVSVGSPVLPDGTQKFKSLCRAAIVTEVDQVDRTHVGLCAINPTGFFFHSLADGGCAQQALPEGSSDPYDGGSWHWPEKIYEDL